MYWLRPEIFIRRAVFAVLTASVIGCGPVSRLETIKDDDVAISQPHELNGDLLFNLLAGEFAGVRGQLGESAGYYLEAAEQTRDPLVVARAAHIALYAKQYEKALHLSHRWQALAGEQQDIDRLRVLIYLNLAKVDEAVAVIDQLLVIDGQVDDQSLISLGRILKQEADPKVAIEVLDVLNQRHQDHPQLMLLLARHRAGAGEYTTALPLVQRIIELEPDLADAYLVKAQVLVGLEQDNAALEAVSIALSKRPDDYRLRMQYARMLVQMKQYKSARKQFEHLQKIKPNDENVLLSLGLLAIEMDDTKTAIVYLQQAVTAGAHNGQAYYYLGRIYQSHGDWAQAIEYYEQVLHGEFVLDARIRSAGLLAQLGEVEAALSKLQMLLKEGVNGQRNIQIYLAQGEVLRNAQREKDAMDIYNQALEKAPTNTDLLYARALTAERLDMLELTESDLLKVLRHEPNNANALNALGYTLADRTSRLQEAKEYILKAAKLLPDDPAILDSLGWVYYRLGEYEKAIKWLRKAFSQMQDAEIAAHLGEVLWVSGQLEDAEKIWQRGLELNANHRVLLNTIKRYKR